MADLAITPASVAPKGGANTLRGTAGATITAGQMVYLDPADNRLKLADCDAPAPNLAARSPSGMALNGAAAGQPLTVALPGADITVNAVLTPGTTYYLSPNPGGIAPLADVLSGDSPVVVGIARSTTVLRLGILESGVTL